MSWLDRFLSWFRPPGPPRPSPIEPFDAAEVIRLMNRERSVLGLHRLQSDPDLEGVARGWAREMAAADVLSHGDFQARIISKFPESLAGEVVAAGQVSAKEVVDSWMASTGHRAQILGSAYSFVGVCREVSSSRIPYWCADFV